MASSAFKSAVASALVLSTGPAWSWEPEEWGPYVAMDVGTTYFRVNKGRLDEWSTAPSSSSSLDKGDGGFSLAAGFRFSRFLAAEAAYLDLGSSSYLIQDQAGTASVGFGSQGLALSMLGTLPISPNLALEGRAGLYFGQAQLHGWVSATIDLLDGDLIALEGAGGGDPGLLIGVGLVTTLSDRWSLRAGYDFLSGNAIDIRNPDLNSRMESSAGRLSLGIRYRF